ncbi:unnamed protein product [Trichobilharzia regenti]|nr:unnamed protein product [Trichobilharzia regenti]
MQLLWQPIDWNDHLTFLQLIFESECRFGSSGRRMPTLFNPIGSHSQDNRVNHSDISRWPMMSDSSNRQLYRMARSPSSSYAQSSSSSPVSQEFLAWQTRQQMPQMMSSNNHPPKMDYGQSINHRDWDTSDKGNSMNSPHDLVRQAGEIKQTVRFIYTYIFFVCLLLVLEMKI